MSYTFHWVPTPGQNNNFVGNNNGTGHVILDSTQNSFVSNPFHNPLYICIPPTTFQGGDAGAASLYDFAKLLATSQTTSTVQNPAINYNGKQIGGGRLTINGNPCGTYEYNVLPTTTLLQTTVASLFSARNDISSWIVCKGDLTLDTGVTLIPTVATGYTQNPPTGTAPDANALRRLFMVIYVTGTLSLASSSCLISMSACGGNSDTTGANIASFQIPVANGLSSGSPAIAAAGTTPTAPTTSSSVGVNGPNGQINTDVYSTGGGGSGYMTTTGGVIPPGSGGAGSCFSGGSGGGVNSRGISATSGSSLGGAGGNSVVSGSTGGTGNPGGTGISNAGNSGTGGVLIIIAETTIIGLALAANGVQPGASVSGGASGGGIIIQISGDGSYIFNAYTTGGKNIGSSAAGGDGVSGHYQI